MRDGLLRRKRAVAEGGGRAQLQHPVIDLTRCLGCGTCVVACPEVGVLEIVHGQAMVVRGANCMGISACERECPTGAIAVRIENVASRRDIPALAENLEAVGTPGLFLAGEVTAHALIRTAINHGTAVAGAVARRGRVRSFVQVPGLTRSVPVRVLAGPEAGTEDCEHAGSLSSLGVSMESEPLDVAIVGAGPAGLACALEAKRLGLSFVVLEQEQDPGGTVAKYPRHKLVMTEPLELPLVGKLRQTVYEKDELLALWNGAIARHALPILGGRRVARLERDANGVFRVHTVDSNETNEAVTAHNVCMAIGRRGTPRKLGVPGEQLSKVSYSLIDAHSYQDRAILVVGGGDSAAEAALGLSAQAGNCVTLSYRGDSFFRIRSRNAERLQDAASAGRLEIVYSSRVLAIHANTVDLEVGGGTTTELENDEVFILAGGTPPFELLEHSGVSFDPALRPEPKDSGEAGSGLLRALTIGAVFSLIAAAFALFQIDYYGLPAVEKPTHVKHDLLGPGRGLGFAFGCAGVILVALNLLYLVRRSSRYKLRMGSLKLWMTSHIATGILALLCVALHAGLAPRDTVGGHAFLGLVLLCATGVIGRYFYAFVPRSTNGRELALTEARTRMARVEEEWQFGQQEFQENARRRVEELVERRQWCSTLPGRVLALFGVERELKQLVADLFQEGRRLGVEESQIHRTVRLARRAHREALMVAHFEDLRALLATWRYLHRWAAALMVLLIVVHVVLALVYGSGFDASHDFGQAPEITGGAE